MPFEKTHSDGCNIQGFAQRFLRIVANYTFQICKEGNIDCEQMKLKADIRYKFILLSALYVYTKQTSHFAIQGSSVIYSQDFGI